jgi:hypothetical protein
VVCGSEWLYSSPKPRHQVEEVSDGLTPRMLSASGERGLGGSCMWSWTLWRSQKSLIPVNIRTEVPLLSSPYLLIVQSDASWRAPGCWHSAEVTSSVGQMTRQPLLSGHRGPVAVVMLRSSKYCTCYVVGNHTVAECYVLTILLFIFSFTCLTTLSVTQTIYSRERQDDSIVKGVAWSTRGLP